MNATISIALIVRDSSATLDKCLSTFKEIADEIVVVDTGSVDNTIEIAKKYTDKIFHFKWIDDFSAARNYSFEKCTKDFIFWVDSDDYILPEDIQKVKDLDLSDKDIVICNYEYAHDEFNKSICTVPRERILRRSLDKRWVGKIHEYINLDCKSLYTSDVSTHHAKQAGTSERNLAILQRVVDEDPNNSRNLFYLGKEFLESGDADKALPYLQLFVDHPDGWWEDKYQAYYKMASIYMGKNDEAKFKEYIFKSLAVEERWAEPYCLLGLHYLNKQIWDKALFWYSAALKVVRPAGLLAYFQPEYYTWLPNLQICLCLNALGDIKGALEANKKVLEYRPNDSRALNNAKILGDALRRSEKAKGPSKTDGQGKRLNLGCGNSPSPGYTNVDIFKGPIVDEIFQFDDIPYTDGSISAILSEHALEHVPFKRAEEALAEWFRVLSPGGKLHLKIPDFHGCCKSYVDSKGDAFNRWWYKATVYGIQESQAGEPEDAQIHKCGFSQEEIKIVLERHGFIVESVVPYDGFRTPSLDIHAVKGSSKLKVGWLAPDNREAAQTRIRVLQVNNWLKGQDYDSALVGSYDEALSCDIVVVGKSFSAQDIEGIKMLKGKGKTVYFDACESLFEFEHFKETLAVCDKVICCSEALAEQCRPVNSNVVVIEDAIETV